MIYITILKYSYLEIESFSAVPKCFTHHYTRQLHFGEIGNQEYFYHFYVLAGLLCDFRRGLEDC